MRWDELLPSRGRFELICLSHSCIYHWHLDEQPLYLHLLLLHMCLVRGCLTKAVLVIVLMDLRIVVWVAVEVDVVTAMVAVYRTLPLFWSWRSCLLHFLFLWVSITQLVHHLNLNPLFHHPLPSLFLPLIFYLSTSISVCVLSRFFPSAPKCVFAYPDQLSYYPIRVLSFSYNHIAVGLYGVAPLKRWVGYLKSQA